MSIGITIKSRIGIGDALQFSSLPENYFRATGERLIDLSQPWFFDHNPFVMRDSKQPPNKTVEMWNFSPKQWDWPHPRSEDEPQVYQCNAEIWASLFKVPLTLNRPRLYMYEDYAYEKRQTVLLHTMGKSHGEMPEHIIEHVFRKYRGCKLVHIGLEAAPLIKKLGIECIVTPTMWDLAKVISEAKMLIGLDSGPAWIAACYPDVVVKKIRMKPTPEHFKNWIPLNIGNIHSHWDDRCHQIFNPTDVDIGFTSSYRKI